MANSEHLSILQEALSKKDIQIWNGWRKSNSEKNPDLKGIIQIYANLKSANLSSTNLKRANLNSANLKSANLKRANLSRADLSRANLHWADLSNANLSNAIMRGGSLTHTNLNSANLSSINLRGVRLTGANLTGANLSSTTMDGVNLSGANLSGANLSGAGLFRANLSGANLTGANLTGANLKDVACSRTIFGDVDLSQTRNLDKVDHLSPSTIGIDTLYKSGGNIPEIFLRGCGVTDNMIVYVRSLAGTAIDYYSVFISYSSANEDFANLLYDTLQGAGIRCWYAPEQLLPGQRIDEGIHRGIQYWDKVLFCASKSSLTEKWWVDFEVDKAFAKSRKLQRERGEPVGVLIPLNLDGHLLSDDYKRNPKASLFESTLAADFVNWESDMRKYNREVQRVIKALQTDGALEDVPESKI